jgi:hypothetical protein
METMTLKFSFLNYHPGVIHHEYDNITIIFMLKMPKLKKN